MYAKRLQQCLALVYVTITATAGIFSLLRFAPTLATIFLALSHWESCRDIKFNIYCTKLIRNPS